MDEREWVLEWTVEGAPWVAPWWVGGPHRDRKRSRVTRAGRATAEVAVAAGTRGGAEAAAEVAERAIISLSTRGGGGRLGEGRGTLSFQGQNDVS